MTSLLDQDLGEFSIEFTESAVRLEKCREKINKSPSRFSLLVTFHFHHIGH